MEVPSSTARRRAWIDSTRSKQSTLEDPEKLLWQSSCSSVGADDDVFTAGCLAGKIGTWLEDCRSEVDTENTSRSFESWSDDRCEELRLGSDAAALNTEEQRSGEGNIRRKFHLPSLHLGQSFASSCNSANTIKTTSSVSEVLQLCSEDAETTLFELGFGRDDPQVAVRIPPRFFTFPSEAKGINFRLFLDSQLQRMREEDPSLCIANRFRQVQALTETANAFYSLYSHVSRTPLQKLVTPEFTFPSSPLERMERFRNSVRSEPRSPVERLKDTVAKMCLYTKSPHESECSSPQASPCKRSSLCDVVELVLDKSKTGAAKRLDLDFDDDDVEESFLETKQPDGISNFDSAESLSSSTSGDTVRDTSNLGWDQRTPVAKVTQDVICPQIVETVHREPFGVQQASTMKERTLDHRSLGKGRQNSQDIPVTSLPACRCSIFVTEEKQTLPQFSIASPDASLVQTRTESSTEGKIHLLHPPQLQSLRQKPDHLRQVNSFELEEVNSAGEEDFGHSGRQLSQQQGKGKVTRGDSAQSDSSGYADEEASQANR